MKIVHLAAITAMCSASTAYAGALDRSGQSVRALFEEGRYAEFSFSNVSPTTSGVASPALGGFDSGDLTPNFFQFGAAYKADINEQWSYAIIYDQPFGADVAYPLGTNYFAEGSNAEFESNAITGILRYKLNNGLSVHGGVRAQRVSANANIPFVAGYSVEGSPDVSFGYLAGIAYERPDIALRVSLTYNSSIEHNVDTVETSAALGGPNTSITTVETPQSINLEFQTGVAKDTLLFGGLRWTEFSEFVIAPADFGTLTGGGALLDYEDDIYTWSLGVGRRLNDTWSVTASIAYEQTNGGFETNLGPTDGLTSLSLAAIYTKDNMTVTTGIRYVDLGRAETELAAVSPAGTFEGNSAVAFGVRVGFTF